ncbi:MAG: hypothetical protein GX347_05105 [Epulopiscium sp.]|nr:hypothetical protein [Candidatus Epulonipiscium sp.]
MSKRLPYYRAQVLLKEQMRGYSMAQQEATGYCKIDIRGERGKCHLSVQNLRPLHQGIYSIYFITASEENPMGLYMGVLDVKSQGRGEMRFDFSPNQLGGSPYTIEDIGAIAILISQEERPGHFICPLIGFIDEPFSWQTKLTIWEKEKENPIKNLNAHILKKDSDSIEDKLHHQDIKEKQDDEVKEDQVVKEEQIVKEENEEIMNNKSNRGEVQDKQKNKNMKEKRVEEDKKVVVTKNTSSNINEWNSWKEKELDIVFQNCPPMNPFENPTQEEEWVRITPREIALLDLPTWSFIHHPLVVEGYYKYNHLLLGRKKEGVYSIIILGVPGQYNFQDESLAYQNGFSSFYCCRDTEPKVGEYGYWIVRAQTDFVI